MNQYIQINPESVVSIDCKIYISIYEVVPRKPTSILVKITNIIEKYVIGKVKTTNVQRFLAKPNIFILDAHKETTIESIFIKLDLVTLLKGESEKIIEEQDQFGADFVR